ncbi:MAG: hypothetical protein V9G19_01585 [Tetrasphaera sp.]
MDDAKFAAFLEIARALNRRGITPLLCGSLGLEVVTGRGWKPQDIDLFVPGDPRGWGAPEEEMIHQWEEIVDLMATLGYRLIDLHEHEFATDEGLHVQFGDLDTLPEFAGIAVNSVRRHPDPRADYCLLTMEQYLALYSASLLDGYRDDGSGHKDEPKIAYLREVISRAQ